MYVFALGLYPRAALVVDVGVAHGATGEFQGAAHEDSVRMDGQGGHHNTTRRSQLTSLAYPHSPLQSKQTQLVARQRRCERRSRQTNERQPMHARLHWQRFEMTGASVCVPKELVVTQQLARLWCSPQFCRLDQAERSTRKQTTAEATAAAESATSKA